MLTKQKQKISLFFVEVKKHTFLEVIKNIQRWQDIKNGSEAWKKCKKHENFKNFKVKSMKTLVSPQPPL